MALGQTAEKDLIVVICSTSLIETGRDFDTDWCVLEPRSVRSVVQAAGRVRRHRLNSCVATPNVCLLNAPLKYFENGAEQLWAQPGIRDELTGLRLTQALPPQLGAGGPVLAPVGIPGLGSSRRAGKPATAEGRAQLHLAAEVLPTAEWEQLLDAQACLKRVPEYAGDKLGFAAQAVQSMHLLRTEHSELDNLPPSVASYLRSLAPLSRNHAQATPFRENSGTTQLFIPSEKKITYWDSDLEREEAVSKDAATFIACSAGHALIRDLPEQAQALSSDSPHIRGCALRCERQQGPLKELCWNPLLGFLEGTGLTADKNAK